MSLLRSVAVDILGRLMPFLCSYQSYPHKHDAQVKADCMKIQTLSLWSSGFRSLLWTFEQLQLHLECHSIDNPISKLVCTKQGKITTKSKLSLYLTLERLHSLGLWAINNITFYSGQWTHYRFVKTDTSVQEFTFSKILKVWSKIIGPQFVLKLAYNAKVIFDTKLQACNLFVWKKNSPRCRTQ